MFIFSDINSIFSDIILWREVTETKSHFFRILEQIDRFQNILLCARF